MNYIGIDMWKTIEMDGFELYLENVEDPYSENYYNATKEQLPELITKLAKAYNIRDCEVYVEAEHLVDGQTKGNKSIRGYIDDNYVLTINENGGVLSWK